MIVPSAELQVRNRDARARAAAEDAFLPTSSLFALRAIDFVSRHGRAEKSSALVEAFLDLVTPFGIGSIAVVDLWRSEPDLGATIRFTTFNPEWVKAYIRDHYDRHDAIWHAALRWGRVHTWTAAWNDAGQERNWVARRYEQFGLVDGLTVPVPNPTGRSSTVFLGSTKPLSLDPASEAALTLAAQAFGTKVMQKMPVAAPDGILSAREREVLTWTALGKNAQQIGTVLDLSEKTVARHLLNIRQKLHCVNTVQAVARAMREGIITI